jgi:hypothetical protein
MCIKRGGTKVTGRNQVQFACHLTKLSLVATEIRQALVVFWLARAIVERFA